MSTSHWTLARSMIAMGVAFTGCGKSGGPVMGALDTHCTLDGGVMNKQPTDQKDCKYKPDGGMDTMTTYGDTRYNSESDDDDCKYHVKYTVAPIYQNSDVTFMVTATRRADGGALSGANPTAEVFLSDTHPAPTTNQKAVEGPPGTYAVGPVRFDASGRWTVRFHFYGDCFDFADDSPHGHAAFFIDMP